MKLIVRARALQVDAGLIRQDVVRLAGRAGPVGASMDLAGLMISFRAMALDVAPVVREDVVVGAVEVGVAAGAVRAVVVVEELTPSCLGRGKQSGGHKSADETGGLHDLNLKTPGEMMPNTQENGGILIEYLYPFNFKIKYLSTYLLMDLVMIPGNVGQSNM
ncbi:hypothetical protein Daesc_007530 [Daldinia eschscholtzii]|uniref:Uncharacterized protein n=1 Tax=Daldinia eschscholtzii TaxID=292717 RepID=A0AAX6MFQ3_9PEZI